MKTQFWNHAEVFDSAGALSLQRLPDGSDLMYCTRCEPSKEAMRVDGATCLSDEDHRAWVNLIAAAPDMLAALRAIDIAAMSDYDNDPSVMQAAVSRARAAIAKATGTEKETT